jgi:hypothetical protein
MFLSPDQVELLTHRKKWKAQARTLARMGVRFMLSAHGRPLVYSPPSYGAQTPQGSEVSLDHAQALLGHTDARVTVRHYRAKQKAVRAAR